MTTEQMQLQCLRYERRERAALAAEVTHPLHEYTPDRVARLWEAIEQARRFSSPSEHELRTSL